MYAVISGTNRLNSQTYKVARQYEAFLKEKGEAVVFLDLCDLPANCFSTAMYSHDDKAQGFKDIEESILKPSTKFLFIMPEYNGSFPGVVKAMIDASDIPPCYYGKKALITGVASGRAGNLRGLEHFTGVLNHVKITVLPNRLPISNINAELSEKGEFHNPLTIKVIHNQIDELIEL